jgi:tRNA 5-methylaminomethyl-2-thiouridine biosynthesis bifunctional protein
MLAGSITKTADNLSRLHYFARIPANISNKTPKIAIVAGGLAGANCAYALSKIGLLSTLYCQDYALA